MRTGDGGRPIFEQKGEQYIESIMTSITTDFHLSYLSFFSCSSGLVRYIIKNMLNVE